MSLNLPENERDLDSPAYKAFRHSVYVRDNFKCQLCGSNYRLNAHHIKRWADDVKLRFSASNGIALCESCHKMVTGNEDSFEERFKVIVKKNTIAKYGGQTPKKPSGKYKLRNPRLRF